MPIDKYGLPGVPALDNPYGLPSGTVRRIPAAPVLPPLPAFAALRNVASSNPAMPPMAPAPVGGGGGGSVVPFRNPAPKAGGQPNAFPVVGQNVGLDQFIDLQRKAESSGNYQALNRTSPGNTASGAYQYTDGTWNNYGGYKKAMLAPKEVQDRRYSEDLARRIEKFNGDIFKVAAEHYLPLQAGNPALWDSPASFKVRGKTVTVEPVGDYLRKVFKGTPYADQLEEYIRAHK